MAANPTKVEVVICILTHFNQCLGGFSSILYAILKGEGGNS